jgi:UTP--glucose-1-phosphate uridylyltransferase
MGGSQFGELMRRQRKQRGRSLAFVAQGIGFSAAFVHAIEKGKHPRLAVIHGICDSLGLRPDERQEMIVAAGYAPAAQDFEVSTLMRHLTDVLTGDLTEIQKHEFACGLNAFIDRWMRHQRPGKQTVTIGVIPAAGWQNHLLPRERLERTLLHAVDEAVQAGIEELVLILAPENPDPELLNRIFDKRVEFKFLIQKQPAGLGHALLQALPCVGEQAFAVILPDEVDEEGRNATKELIDQYQEVPQPLIAVNSKTVSTSGPLARYYGLAVLGQKVAGRVQLYRLKELKEKPGDDFQGDARCIAGRYILTPDIFAYIHPNEQAVQRYELTDALRLLLKSPKPPYAYKLDRTLKPLALLRAMVDDMDANPLFNASHYYAEDRTA